MNGKQLQENVADHLEVINDEVLVAASAHEPWNKLDALRERVLHLRGYLACINDMGIIFRSDFHRLLGELDRARARIEQIQRALPIEDSAIAGLGDLLNRLLDENEDE